MSCLRQCYKSNKENYEKEFEFNTIDIIKLINSAGGVCSIAHPHTVKNAEKLIPKLVKNGLMGIEIVERARVCSATLFPD